MEKLDISWGSPQFLEPYWNNKFFLNSVSNFDMSYSGTHGREEILELILALHARYHSLDLNKKWHIVIGNGATQVLQSAIAALEAKTIFIAPPYFVRFPHIIRLAGKQYTPNPSEADGALFTIPNNPDFSIQDAITKGPTLYDMCYNWPTFHNQRHAPYKNINYPQIYSLSKLSGHASTRLGWAITDDEEYANKMKQYIEYNTCGVSVDAQLKATYIIQHILKNPINCMDEGRDILLNRWEGVRRNALPVENNRGMFIWSADRKYWEDRNIQGISGAAFGVDDNYYRLNIGCSHSKWKEFVERCF